MKSAAKNLLCEEKLSIEQIANYLDFSSQSHFTAVFVRQLEQPRQYGEKNIKRAILKFRYRIPKSDAETGTMEAGRE